jgi:hypothetical protein
MRKIGDHPVDVVRVNIRADRVGKQTLVYGSLCNLE